jgi:hypothetical protein
MEKHLPQRKELAARMALVASFAAAYFSAMFWLL